MEEVALKRGREGEDFKEITGEELIAVTACLLDLSVGSTPVEIDRRSAVGVVLLDCAKEVRCSGSVSCPSNFTSKA